jgi:hypothetical protein
MGKHARPALFDRRQRANGFIVMLYLCQREYHVRATIPNNTPASFPHSANPVAPAVGGQNKPCPAGRRLCLVLFRWFE